MLVLGLVILLNGCRKTSGSTTTSANTNVRVEDSIVDIIGVIPNGRVAGTGMVLTPDGAVLTNNHVIAGTTGLTVRVAGVGHIYQATVVGVDPIHDVAVIKLTGASSLPVIPLDTTGAVSVGDHVTAEGNALGKGGAPAVAPGVVTSLDETIGVGGDGTAPGETISGLIEVDAHLQPGDSGGPLLNQDRRVIGMDTVGRNPNDPLAPLNFGGAIPINTALRIAHQILSGVTSAYIQPGHTGELGVTVAHSSTDGALVETVTPGSAADMAGIVPGDRITFLGPATIATAADLAAAIQGRLPGDRVSVTFLDAIGQRHQLMVVLTPGPPA